MCAITFFVMLPQYLLLAFVVVAFEASGRYVEAAVVTVGAVPVLAYGMILPGLGGSRLAERWAAGHKVDRARALEATYTYARGTSVRGVVCNAVFAALFFVVVGALAGASGSRLVQYGVMGAATGTVLMLIVFTASWKERCGQLGSPSPVTPGSVTLCPARARPLPRGRKCPCSRSRARSRSRAPGWRPCSIAVRESPLLAVMVGCALTLFFGVPITVGAVFSPSMRPIRDLAEGTERVAAGDYSRRLPVVQDDDLGALAASFNRMQAGLAERQRLQAAFGTYVDPALAARLLEQGDDMFTGERREVTVMFVDIRDFTPFAEANTAEDTVSRLKAVFEIVVPAVVDAGGHVNKFLGDGALAVFGAPNDLVDHADAAVSAAVLIHRLVAERFGGALRIGIGINTGVVIAGTIGGGGKLEFTLIGDTVNVAARVEQLTKITGDAILITHHTVDALNRRPRGLADRGSHELKGKLAAVKVFGLDPTTTATC